LLDDLLRIVHETLTQKDTMAVIREKIRAELPTLLRLYRADKFLVNRIVASAGTFFEEVRKDPNHPFRAEFDRMVLSFVDRLGSDRSYVDRIDGFKRDLLARPELARCCGIIWLGCSSRPARRSRATPSCAAKSTRASSRCCEVSSPTRRAACRASSPIR
jgi:uncharacterized membrane-anchored protein YjiN (DUF445 family)